MLCVAADGLELLRDSVQLALAYYVSRMSSGVGLVATSSRLARLLLVPAGLRTIPAFFVKMVFFSDVMFSEPSPRMRQHFAIPQ